MRLGHLKCMRRRHNFIFFVGKARVFSPNSVRNSHYIYWPSSFLISRSEKWQGNFGASGEFLSAP